MLNELDNELEGRGHKFVRYADDCMIFCRSKRSAHRVKESITKFIEHTLYLRVNREKTTVGNVIGMKFLGYSFYLQKGGCRLCVHPKSYQKLKTRLKELTGRSNGMGYDRRKHELHQLLRGWVEYFKLADMQSRVQRIDEWLRRRLRMCIWKSWKNAQTRIRNLIRCGIDKWKAGQWGYVKGYWRVAGSPILQRSVTIDNLRKSGYPCLMDYYCKLHRK
jgi:hypothetical protein